MTTRSDPSFAAPRLLHEILRLSAEHPLDRKLLVCEFPAQGRELLRSAALAGCSSIGWDVTSVRQLAHELVVLQLAGRGESLADDFDLVAILDEAIDTVAAHGRAGPFGTRDITVFRTAIHRSIRALRLAGITPRDLRTRRRAGRKDDPKLSALAAILEETESRLRSRRKVDEATVLRLAIRGVEEGSTALPDGRLFLLPGHGLRGTRGYFLQMLERAGATTLETDAVIGLSRPGALLWAAPEGPTGPLSTLHRPAGAAGGDLRTPHLLRLFAAATPMDELREILRRVVQRGIPWDQVEIVASDPTRYGATLDTLSRRLGIPATHTQGVDSQRTRIGRAVTGWFRWMEEDFSSEILRGLLESGDVELPADRTGHPPPGGAALARRLRRLRIGWGRERYGEAIERALRAASRHAADASDTDAGSDDGAAHRARELAELRALELLVRRMFRRIPPSPDRGRTRSVRASPAAIAAGLSDFLELVPAGDLVENTLRQVTQARLERIIATLTRETGWEAALGILRDRLAMSFAPSADDGPASWISTGGRLHMSDFASGGLANRPFTFVVGLDAGALSSMGGSDPLLADSDKQLLNGGTHPPPLATSSERVEEARFRAAALLARLRGEVTLSYSAWDMMEGRSISPAPELLQALRLREGREELSYGDLRTALGALASSVPGESGLLDEADVWLAALDDGGILRSGSKTVRSVFPGLDRGLLAIVEREKEDEVTAWQGALSPASPPGLASEVGAVFSASRLETLGACPRRYYYRYLLNLSPIEEMEWDPAAWLGAGHRGNLLHKVFERTLQESRGAGILPPEPAFEARALEILEKEAELMCGVVPPPGKDVFEDEVAALRDDVGSFVRMIRQGAPEWIETELEFGPQGREVTLETRVGTVKLRGAIDRVDRIPGSRGVRVVDYKTGGSSRFRPARPFDGGRRIQHVLYTHAAGQLLDAPVEAMEYHFPTRRGENRVVRYSSAMLRQGGAVIDTLLGIVEARHFMTTDEPRDCAYCDFKPICRADTNDWGQTTCAEPQRMKDTGIDLPAHERLRALRKVDEEGICGLGADDPVADTEERGAGP